MAIKTNSGFLVQAPVALDEKAYLKKSDMLTVNEAIYPDYYLVVCADDGYLYMFDKKMAPADVSATTGKFKKFAGDVDEAIAILNGTVDKTGSVLNTVYNKAADAKFASEEVTIEEIDMTPFSVDNIVITKAELDTIKATPDTAAEIATGYELTYVSATTSYTITDTVASNTQAVTITEKKDTVVTTIKKAVENLAESAEVTLTTLTTATDGYLKTYEIKQGKKVIGKIDIPKDLVVSNGNVIEIEESTTTPGTFNVKGDTTTYTSTEVTDDKSAFYGFPLVKGVYIKLVIANQKNPIFIDAATLVDTGSLGKTTVDITANVECGGIAKGAKVAKGSDLESFVKQLLTKYYAPELTVSVSVSNKIQRVGTTLTNVEITAVATKKSEDITSVEVNGVTQAGDVSNGGTYKETVPSITTTSTYSATVTDGKTPVTKSVTYTFVLPYMQGDASKGTIDADTDLTALTEIVEVEGKKSISYTATNQYLIFIQPASYAAITAITDQNGFANYDSWNVSTYTNAAGEDYRCYVTKTPVTCSGFKYTFE